MSKTRVLIENACYHLFVRGNHKQNVFRELSDYRFYLLQLRRYKRKHSFLLYGYCLMPNHIHLIGQPKDSKKLSKFMQGLHRSYTAYYNKKYNKVGHLWQNRFKSKAINKDEYLIDCIAYIEQNPVRANMVSSPKEYTFSSYLERECNIDEDLDINLLDNLLI
ncbi:MAG: transposase [Candidatus Omnitrophica bacterium]|nr:transposase [Candidatus Omnitrophota bacterium]